MRLRTVFAAVRAARRDENRCQVFADALAVSLEGARCIPVSSGRAALAIILMALREGHDPGRDEVVIPAYTCFSVPSAIVRAGLKVMPCDIDPQHLDYDQSMLPKVVSSRTLCIVPTHLFGFPARMDLARELASGDAGRRAVEAHVAVGLALLGLAGVAGVAVTDARLAGWTGVFGRSGRRIARCRPTGVARIGRRRSRRLLLAGARSSGEEKGGCEEGPSRHLHS